MIAAFYIVIGLCFAPVNVLMTLADDPAMKCELVSELVSGSNVGDLTTVALPYCTRPYDVARRSEAQTTSFIGVLVAWRHN